MKKKPALLLHIGTEKTGTTSIQEFLSFNRARLAESGILYPVCLGEKNHIKLAAYADREPWPFASVQLGIDTHEKQQAFCLDLERQLQDELAKGDYHHAIISNEHLHSNITSPEQIQSLQRLLVKFFSDIRVLVYFRRQDLMSVSLYSTALLVGFTPSRQLDLSAAKSYYYDFNAIYQNWASCFGPEHLEARIFSRERLIAGNVIADFCAAAGLGEELKLVMTERKNESLSLEAACLVLELNERIKEGRLVLPTPVHKRNHLIRQFTEQFKGAPHYPGREAALRFYQACAESNNALQRRLNIPLFNEDFSMYPEQEDVALYNEKRLWAKTALDSFDLQSPMSGVHKAKAAKPGNAPTTPILQARSGVDLKIAIIGNCQAQPLSKALSAFEGVKATVPVPIHQYGTKHFLRPEEEFKALIQEPEAVVLSFVNGPRFNDFATATLKQTVKPLYTLTNIHFSGLHPDITYVGDQGGRIPSPLGDYHSKIILHSFLTGRSKPDCLARFCGNEYARLGYYQEFEKAATELRARDKELDIQFAEKFLSLLKEIPCLYTQNHPTPVVFQEYVLLIAQYLGLKAWRQPIELLPNYLAHSTWWPVYAEIAELHGLKYRMPLTFKQAEPLGGKFMELEQLIHASYQIYEKIPKRIRGSRQAAALQAHFSE